VRPEESRHKEKGKRKKEKVTSGASAQPVRPEESRHKEKGKRKKEKVTSGASAQPVRPEESRHKEKGKRKKEKVTSGASAQPVRPEESRHKEKGKRKKEKVTSGASAQPVRPEESRHKEKGKRRKEKVTSGASAQPMRPEGKRGYMMKPIVTGLLMLLGSLSGFAQGNLSVQFGGLKKSTTEGDGVVLTTREAQVRLSVYGPEIIRVRVTQGKPAPDFSYAVVGKPDGKLTKLSENEQEIVYSTGRISVTVNKSPLRLRFTDSAGRVISEDDLVLGISWMGTQVTSYRKLFPDERFIGLGEKTGGLNRRGNSYVHWNSDVPAYALDKDPLYSSIPFFIGLHDRLTYGIFLDNSYKTFFDFGASTNGRMSSFGAPDGELNYYLISGATVADVIRNYTALTGRAKLPPLWSFGYQQCRWSYYPDKELLTIAKTFRDKQIPIDVLYLDIHYMDQYKIFTFSPENYPNPKETIAELKKMGFRVVVIIDPGLKVESGYQAYEEGVRNNYFVKYPDGTDYTGSVWPGPSHFPDFTNPVVREWWGKLFKVYTDTGIDGYWNDMNEPAVWGQNIPDLVQFDFDGHKTTMRQAHNVYGMQMVRSTYEGVRKLNPDKRPLTITRATYAGGQRYSTIWTGDNASYDDHMLLGVRR